MPMLSRNLEKTLRRALALANARQHEYATLEHLLMALTDDEDAADVLAGCGVDLDRVRANLDDFLDHELTSLAVGGWSTPSRPRACNGSSSVRRCTSRAPGAVR
jgi:ATP-dependent Clp protease ATP-binding subunit ClpA